MTVVPVWRSKRRELRGNAPKGEADGEAVDDPVRPLLTYVEGLARDFELFAAGAAPDTRPVTGSSGKERVR